ncbi:MAG: hypothetical protein GKS06_19380 [Acidobacteria bacterium]|nr:hypothetical protein [Acidobacteriota bacterium]
MSSRYKVPLVAVFVAVALPAAAQQSLESPQLSLLASWGCAECSGAELLGEIQSVTLAPNGTAYALDSFEPAIRIFVRDQPAGAFGQEGEGPGEFQLASFAGAAPSGLEVIDTRHRRISRLTYSGDLVDTRRLTGFPTYASYDTETGTWYFATMDWASGGARVTRLEPLGSDPIAVGPTDFPLSDKGTLAGFYPIAARPGGGFAVGDGAREYRIRIYSDSGDLRHEIHRPLERMARTPAEMEFEQERMAMGAAAMARLANAEGGTRTMPEVDPLKRHFYVHALRYDDHGRLWVLTRRGNENHSIFDIYSPTGADLGEVSVPGMVDRFDVRGQRLLTAGITEDWVPVVRLWDLEDSAQR